jgi:hypothetical protein
MLHRRKRRQALVMVLALFVTFFLFIFGGVLLAGVERDLGFENRRQLQARAHYLALSGVQYYQHKVVPPQAQQLAAVALAPGQLFSVGGSADGTVTSRGYILSPSGAVLAEKTLVVPHGLAVKRYAK